MILEPKFCLFEDPHVKVEDIEVIVINSYEYEDLELPNVTNYGFMIVLTHSQASCGQALYIPHRYVKKYFDHLQPKITVFDQAGRRYVWALKWSLGREEQCHIGLGWYDFWKEQKLAAGDFLEFVYNESNKSFTLGIDRN